MHTVSDSVLGAGRLLFDGVGGLATLVERMHETIARRPLPFSRETRPEERRASHGRLAANVYESIRTVNGWAGDGFEFAVGPLLRALDDPTQSLSLGQEAAVSALNGVYGDHLDATGNPLAIPMTFRIDGRSLEPAALATQLPDATPHVVVLIHGLCLSDRWHAEGGESLGSRLREAGNFTPLTLRYNTGRHISTNGRELAEKLEALLAAWPVEVESLSLIGHSMGGLLARSAGGFASEAGHRWVAKLRRLVCLGSPHHGAPLEKGGNLLAAALRQSPYTDPLGLLGRVRSAGIKDLRFGNLCDEDWQGRDPDALARDVRRPLPLLPDVETRFAAATLARQGTDLRFDVVGDGLVSTASALGRHADRERRLRVPPEHRHVFYRTGHLELIDSPLVHQKIVEWLTGPA